MEGFANWGHPGSSSDYENTETVGGVLIGKKGDLNGLPVRSELDGTFGKISSETNQLDPEGWMKQQSLRFYGLLPQELGWKKKLDLQPYLLMVEWPGQ